MGILLGRLMGELDNLPEDYELQRKLLREADQDPPLRGPDGPPGKACRGSLAGLKRGAMKGIISKLPLGERLFWAEARFAPGELLAELAKDRSKTVREKVAENPATPPHVLLRLAKDKERWWSLARNPASPPALLERLWKAYPDWFASSLAKNPSTPACILEEITQRYPEHRRAIMKNPKAPKELLERLLEEAPSDQDKALNPACPPELLLRFAQESRLAPLVASNPSTPEEALRRLAEVPEPMVREQVAKNPATPEAVLWTLATDEWYVRKVVALNPSCPEELLRRLGRDDHWAVRASVAGNPNCPPDLLEELSLDQFVEVREAALTNPSLTLVASPQGEHRKDFLSLILLRFERTGTLLWREAYKLIPFLDRLPQDPRLWLAIWKALDERGRELLCKHPYGRGVALLGSLGG